MSSNKPPSAAQRLQQKPPIEVSPDQLSFFIANAHPVFVLTLLFTSFRYLVSDPKSTLLALAPVLAIVQTCYCMICLPTTGQAPPPKPGQKKKSKQDDDIGTKLVPAFISLLITFVLTTPLLFITVILFGGPMISQTEETLLLALHFALFVSPQLFYAHGLNAETWLRIASLQLPIDESYGMSLGACLGAWIGAIPIPLDWDRDWQRWPVTIVAGIYIGAVVGKLAGGHLLKGVQMRIT